MIPRRKRNSSKINLTISAIFHGLLVLAVFVFAAREGFLGKKLKEISVTLVPKEKKPEPPKEKPAPPKEQPKVAEPPKAVAVAPPPRADMRAAPPPPAADAAPSVAPAAAVLPSFSFSDGAHDVQSVSDPNLIYKGLVEHTLRSRWQRPEDVADENFVAEIELAVDPTGRVTGYTWLKGSGNPRWDDSVKSAVSRTAAISRPPPKKFPPKFLVRFDTERLQSDDSSPSRIE